MNQLVARRMLERLGCRVDIASNGHEAVQALERIPFALVLMDVRMPEMDGLEATVEIRKRESRVGGHVPIVAMTASAMPEDRQMCLAAGMDDFLAKPIRQADLDGIIRRWANAQPAVGADLEAWLVDAYLAEETVMQDELRAALQARDGARVAAGAHKLKGAAAIVGANALVALCGELEQLGRDDAPVDSEAWLERLAAASAVVREALVHSAAQASR